MSNPGSRQGESWEGVHTCSNECPCQTGGEPLEDFVAGETMDYHDRIRFNWLIDENAEALEQLKKNGG